VSPDLEEALEELFQKAMDQRAFSGASLAIAQSDGIPFTRCWGTTHEVGKPVDEHTRFDLASLTKPLVTASLCIWAVSNGRLDLDSRLEIFLPRHSVPASMREVSIRHLLNHSSGLPAYSPFYKDLIGMPQPERRAAQLTLILNSPTSGKPGTVSRYSDLGYILLGILLEDLLGDSLDSLAARLLSSSFFDRQLHYCRMGVESDPTRKPGRSPEIRWAFAATEFCPWRKRLLLGEVHDENAYCLGGVAGHAGLFGTASGVVRWLQWLSGLYKGEHRDSSWSAAVVREFWDRPPRSPTGTWVLGFDTPSPSESSAGKLVSPRSVGHLGFTGTSFWLDLEKDLLIVLLTNRVYPSRSNDKIKCFRPVLHDLVMKGMHGT
jgi:CubicO group peptidase (beta-lactamase class C family)